MIFKFILVLSSNDCKNEMQILFWDPFAKNLALHYYNVSQPVDTISQNWWPGIIFSLLWHRFSLTRTALILVVMHLSKRWFQKKRHKYKMLKIATEHTVVLVLIGCHVKSFCYVLWISCLAPTKFHFHTSPSSLWFKSYMFPVLSFLQQFILCCWLRVIIFSGVHGASYIVVCTCA